ncbi:hypothetical protein BH11PSE2_BH11PSE2_00080 [soil metagenome]
MIEMTRRSALAGALMGGAALSPLGSAVAQTAAPKAPAKVFPFPTTVHDLANGLRVVVIETGFPDIVAVQIPMSVGSRNEVEPGKSGFAHFFEHMMFRGTKAYPSEKYNDIIKQIGGDQNAFTSDDLTNFHTTFNKEDLETVLKIEADRFQNLDYSEPDFRTESLAVYGEYNKNSASPVQKLFEVQRNAAFKVHTYKHTTMGFLEDIKAMPEQFAYSRQFFDRYYRPERATLVVAGDVKPDAVFALAEKYWGSWKRGGPVPAVPAEPAQAAPICAHVPWPSQTLPWMTVGFRGPAAYPTKDNPAAGDQQALDVLGAYAFSESSPLYQRLVVKEQKVEALAANFGDSVDPGLLTVMAQVKDKADMAYVRDAIQDELAQLRVVQADPARIADIRSNLKYRFASRLDNTEAVAGAVVRYLAATRDIDTINEVYRRYDAVTPADIQRVANLYFVDRSMTVTTLANGDLPAAAAGLGGVDGRLAALRGRPAAPMSKAALIVARPAPKAPAAPLKELIQKSVSPLVDVRLRFMTGSVDDPAGKAGLSVLTALMVTDAGSKAMTYEAIQQALFPMAAGFGATVDKEVTTFSGKVHRDNLERWYDIIGGQLLEPGFRDEDFTRVKSSLVNDIRVSLRDNNDEELGNEVLYEQLYAGHPYGRLTDGHAAEVEKLTLEDVRSFHHTHYSRESLTLALAGAVSDPFLAKVRGDLSASLTMVKRAPRAAIPAAKKPTGLDVTLVQKQTRSAAISMGFPFAVKRGHPDFVALYLARSYLGEHRNSSAHLYQRMREIRGMNYGDYAYTEYFPGGMFRTAPPPGVPRSQQAFRIWVRPVPPEQTHFAIRIAKYELDKLVREGMSQADFDATKSFLMKSTGLLTARQGDRLGYALDQQFYGAPEFGKYIKDGLAKLTAASVNAAIRRHLGGPDMAIVVVTPEAEALAKALIEGAPSPLKYASSKPAAILEEDKVIERYPLGLKASDVKIVALKDVFEKDLFG